jgi:hypothetical protein
MAMRYKPAVKVRFPSTGFFQALADRMNEQTEKYRRFGTVDLRLGVRIEADGRLTRDRSYALMFSGYWCDQVAEPERPEAFIADCTIAGPYRAWKEMFENIEALGAADERHTLNYLVNLDDPFRIEAQDQFEADKLYRYMYSLQLFLEESARLQVEYAV